MQIFIINLDSETRRRAFMKEQMERLGLKYEFFSAVKGHELTKEEIVSKVSIKWSKIYEGRELSFTEIGCALSHLEIYKKIIKDKIPYSLILEDDAWLTPSIVEVLKDIESQNWGDLADAVLLSDGCKYGKLIINNHEYYSLYAIKGGYNAHAYIITQQGAIKLSGVLSPVCHVADCWSWLVQHNILRIRAIRPILATQNRKEFGSSTVIGRKNIQSLKTISWFAHKMKRVLWKTLDRIYLLPYNHQ